MKVIWIPISILISLNESTILESRDILYRINSSYVGKKMTFVDDFPHISLEVLKTIKHNLKVRLRYTLSFSIFEHFYTYK